MKGMDMTNVETVSPRGLDLQERVIEINRVAKVVKGGALLLHRARSPSATKRVWSGSATARPRGPAGDPEGGRERRKSLIRVPKYGQTLTHKNHRPLRRRPRRPAPASPGTGVIAGGGVRACSSWAGCATC
jgi:small subunit ribosomal protein S5